MSCTRLHVCCDRMRAQDLSFTGVRVSAVADSLAEQDHLSTTFILPYGEADDEPGAFLPVFDTFLYILS